MKRVQNGMLKPPTYRLELLNAAAMILWGFLLTFGSYIGYNRADMMVVKPLPMWILSLLTIGLLQVVGVLYGFRIIRAVAAAWSGIILFSLVYTVAKRGYLYPFVSFGFVWAIGQYISLYYVIRVEKVRAILDPCRKVEDIDSRTADAGSTGTDSSSEHSGSTG